MKVVLAVLIAVAMLAPASALAQYYDGTPFYGVSSAYKGGAKRFYDVNNRYNGQ
jgi:hypothetical protein